MATQKVVPTELDITKGREVILRDYWSQADINSLFVEGDHWQEGDGWIGPMPDIVAPNRDVTVDLIRKTFTSRNVIKEINGRHVDGLLGREPEWGFTVKRAMKKDEVLGESEESDIDEIEAAFTDWWNQREILKHIVKSAEQVLWGKRSVLRLMVPSGFLTSVRSKGRQTTGIPKAPDLLTALMYIWPDVPLPKDAVVYVDPDTKEYVGILITKDAEDNDVIEISYVQPSNSADPNAVRLTVMARTSKTESTSVTIDLGKKITMYQMDRDPLITEQVQEQQRALNLAISMMPRAIVTSGFLERVILGGQAPGEWKEDSKTHEKYFVPGNYVTGAGTTNFISGQEVTDEEGKVTVTTPRIEWKEPSDPQGPVKAARFHYQNILEEVDQEHILISGDAMASGKAREMARQGYVLSLKRSQKPVESLGRWILETALAMAETFMGSPGKYSKSYRAYFNCRIDTGPVSSDERISYAELVDRGMISMETAMHLVNIDDVDAEIARIQLQEGHKLHVEKRLAEAIKLFIDAGFPMEQALLRCGFSPTDASKIAEASKKEAEEKAAKELDAEVQKIKAKPAAEPNFGAVA